MGWCYITIIAFTFFNTFLFQLQVCNGKFTQTGDQRGGTIKFESPTLDDEDTHSPHLPKDLRCDACRIIALKMKNVFTKANKKRKSLKGHFPEADIIDMVEEVCEDKFESTGIKEINGVRRMSTPGYETADTPGVMQGGGRWPFRLQSLCMEYAGEIGEIPIYEAYRKTKNIEKFLCYGEGLKGYCSSDDAMERMEHYKKRQKEEDEKMRKWRDEEEEKERKRKEEL